MKEPLSENNDTEYGGYNTKEDSQTWDLNQIIQYTPSSAKIIDLWKKLQQYWDACR